MPLELDYEAAARKLCARRLINPDTMVKHPLNPSMWPAWRLAEEEIRRHSMIQDAMNGCWIEKKFAGEVDVSDLV